MFVWPLMFGNCSSLFGNKIKSVARNAFSGLGALEHLWVSHHALHFYSGLPKVAAWEVCKQFNSVFVSWEARPFEQTSCFLLIISQLQLWPLVVPRKELENIWQIWAHFYFVITLRTDNTWWILTHFTGTQIWSLSPSYKDISHTRRGNAVSFLQESYLYVANLAGEEDIFSFPFPEGHKCF